MWKKRNLWALLPAIALAVAASLFLLWVIPSDHSDSATPGENAVQDQAAVEGTGEDTGGGQTQPPAEQAQPPAEQPAGQVEATPGAGSSGPANLNLQFPDPAGTTPESPPLEGYKDILGHWVVKMEGASYGLQNCHLYLEEGGGISAPPDYAPVFEVLGSSYTWKEGDPSFQATLQIVIKMGSGQTEIPVQLELVGTVSESLDGITGDFTATPQGEAYMPYAQQGDFEMHRP